MKGHKDSSGKFHPHFKSFSLSSSDLELAIHNPRKLTNDNLDKAILSDFKNNSSMVDKLTKERHRRSHEVQ